MLISGVVGFMIEEFVISDRWSIYLLTERLSGF